MVTEVQLVQYCACDTGSFHIGYRLLSPTIQIKWVYRIKFIKPIIQDLYALVHGPLTLSLPVMHICVNFSTVYNDTLVAKGLIELYYITSMGSWKKTTKSN